MENDRNDYVEETIESTLNNDNEHNKIVPLKPSSWLWQSVLVTLCCFPIFGIIGLVNGMQVNSNYYAGNYDRAERLSRRAKMWAISGFAFGIIYFIIALVAMTNSSLLNELNSLSNDGVYSIYNY